MTTNTNRAEGSHRDTERPRRSPDSVSNPEWRAAIQREQRADHDAPARTGRWIERSSREADAQLSGMYPLLLHTLVERAFLRKDFANDVELSRVEIPAVFRHDAHN
jgi:hypothetical protein